MQKEKPESPSLIQSPPSLSRVRKWLDFVWILVPVAFLATALGLLQPGRSCAYLGTDFRGYYASAQIALKYGFSQVYDQELQNEFQDNLLMHCPDGSFSPPLLHVSMPYLPVFVLLFVPLTLFGYTTSYLFFSILNLVVLAAYLLRFYKALGIKPSFYKLLEWFVCLPVLSNLVLGQMNIFLVVCFGEFILASLNGKQVRSGGWLAGMMIKPYTLILLLPGLAVSQRWRVLFGFAVGVVTVFGSSILLAGVDGIIASLNLAIRFAGSLIHTGPSMMNWRALALNLKALLPDWLSWGIAIFGMAVVTAIILREWYQFKPEKGNRFFLLALSTLAATFTLSWHSHFYLMLLLIPILASMDHLHQIPSSLLAAWVFAPLGLYVLFSFKDENLARNMLGLGYFGFNLILLTWAIRYQRRETSPPKLEAHAGVVQ